MPLVEFNNDTAVVSDASPLISLAKINYLRLLKDLFHKIVISVGVYNEIAIKGKILPGSNEVASAVKNDFLRSAKLSLRKLHLL